VYRQDWNIKQMCAFTWMVFITPLASTAILPATVFTPCLNWAMSGPEGSTLSNPDEPTGRTYMNVTHRVREGAREKDEDLGPLSLSPDHCRHSCWQYFNFILKTFVLFSDNNRSTGQCKVCFQSGSAFCLNSPVFYAMYWSLISNSYEFWKVFCLELNV